MNIRYFLLSLILLLSLGNPLKASPPEKPYLNDNKRYLALLLLNDDITAPGLNEIQAAYDKGFNAVYIAIKWSIVKCFDNACRVGRLPGSTGPNPSWNPANRNWTIIDNQVAKAKSLGMKIAFRVHLGSTDHGYGISKYLWGENSYAEREPGNPGEQGIEDLSGYDERAFSLSKQTAIDSAKNFMGEVLNRYGYLEGENNLLFVTVSMSTAQETEYPQGGSGGWSNNFLLDYSTASRNDYNAWYQSKYSTNYPSLPTEFTSTEGKKWYTFRHKKLKEFINQMVSKVKTHNSNIKFISDFGSAFDGLSHRRNTLGFKSLNENTDGLKVNDDYSYDHRFSMDIIRGTMPGKFLMNEYLVTDNSRPNSFFYDWINQSFAHGAKLFSVATDILLLNHYSSVYSQIASEWLGGTMGTLSTNGTINYTFSEIHSASFNGNRFATSSRNIYQEWFNQYNSNPAGSKPVNVVLNDDELNDCTAPAAPTLTASPSTITSGGSSTLTAGGCSGGTITWSDGLGAGTTKSVSLTATKTYTATCTVSGCTSAAGSVTVTVNPPPGGSGCVVNKVRLQFRTAGDCCMDRLVGAKIQGSNNGTTWTDLYTISVNGTGSFQEFTFSNTIFYSSVRFAASANGYGELKELEFYNGSTKLSGTAFGTYNYSMAFDGSTSTDLWHISGPPGPSNAYAGLNLIGCSGCSAPAAPTLTASPSTITSGSNSTLTAGGCSGGTITWSDSLGTGTTKSVSPTATKTYTATCTVSGCTSAAGSVTVTVNPPPGGSGCVVNKVRLQFRTAGDCCMDRLVGAKIQGSNNGTTWTDLYTISVNGTGSFQEFTFSNTISYSSVRFAASANGYGELKELEFYNGSTKLSGTAFGTYNYSMAFDGSTSTDLWHISGPPGPSNAYAGLNLTGCGSPLILGDDPNESININRIKGLLVSPNPSKGVFETRFYLEKNKKAALIVSDLQGRTIFRKAILGQGNHKERIDLTNKASSIIFLQLRTDKGVEINKISIVR